MATPPFLTGVGDDQRAGGASSAQLVSDPDGTFGRRWRDLGIRAQRHPHLVRGSGSRHAALYRSVLAGETPLLELPRSPRARRAAARAEFGPVAATTAGTRPFALPLLRRGDASSLCSSPRLWTCWQRADPAAGSANGAANGSLRAKRARRCERRRRRASGQIRDVPTAPSSPNA